MHKAKLKQKYVQSSEAGLTIVESLMAIIVVGLMITLIAPVVALSVANRAQAKRKEIAINAVKSYIDVVRTDEDLEGNPYPYSPPISTNTLTDVPAPSTNELTGDCTIAGGICKNPPNDYALYCVDGNGDNQCTTDNWVDAIVQAAGSVGNIQGQSNITNPEPEDGYQLLVRVYRADAFAEQGTLEADNTASSFATGIRKNAPQEVAITEILTSETSYSSLCERINIEGEGKCALGGEEEE
ncbi:MAG: hormogonium polysaccharide secretion pseudopilin HpsB [Oscillatoria sp. PMC 1051.18]|nr:hormogonium polysaccharide secretion pseudopilin HpsB [Oscillatoria sp. PMC 1050.18]MEC5031079.1 hormogonium polysaccharide secretion pseudopilin HpsB [Oscillatoria sp. PMC 1051.18]